MIPADKRAHIRRLFYAEHWKIGTIASALGVHASTVKKAIESERFAPRARPVRPTSLDPYKAFIAETLEQYPRLRSTRLHEMLVQRGYPGSAVQLRRYVKTVRPQSKREAFLRLTTLPGEQAQVDWGHFGKLQVGSGSRVLSCFVMVLSHSRAMFARFFLNQTMECFLRGHIEAFAAFGGVPRNLLYDNLKSVVVERDGDLFRFHPNIVELASHYHFSTKVCAPYRGNEKGKVERAIQYLRHSFFAARRFGSLQDLNSQLRTWIDDVAHVRPVPGASPPERITDALARERHSLLPLPEHPFSADHVQPIRSGKTPYVRFDRNDYSIPHTAVREPLTLVASETRVRILDAAQSVIAEHARSYDDKARIEDPAHIRDLARAKSHAQVSTVRQQLMLACPHAAPFFAELHARDTPMRQHTSKLHRLLTAYGKDELDDALRQAIERGAISAASVAHLLDQARRRSDRPPVLVPILSEDPRIHQIHATPHSLTAYDQLVVSERRAAQTHLDDAQEPTDDSL